MITAEFFLRGERFLGVSVRGHAGYAAYGHDVVCASVTSAVELVANGITEMDNARTFCVADRDWYGVFYMQRNAFGASCKFDMHEI